MNEVKVDGPMKKLFCPVCCNLDRYHSVYKLREHIKSVHLHEIDDPYWNICKNYVKGRIETDEFYSELDRVTESICEFDQ